jgi:hypothetical protein
MARRKPCHFYASKTDDGTDQRAPRGFFVPARNSIIADESARPTRNRAGAAIGSYGYFLDQLRPCDQPAPNLINIDNVNPRPTSLDQSSPGFRPLLTSIEHVYLHTCKGVGSVGYNVLIRGGIRI